LKTFEEGVIVVGAGPTGALLSYLLAKEGIQTTLIERHQDFSREFRGEVLMPGGCLNLEQIGLGPDLENVPHVCIPEINVYINRKPAISIAMKGNGYDKYPPKWISQPHFLEMLVSKSAEYENFRLLRGVKVRDLINKDGHIIGVTADSEIKRNRIFGKLVIGADGRSSITRARSGIVAKQDPMPMDIVWIKIPQLEKADDVTLNAYVGGGHLVFCAGTYDGQIQIGFVIKKGTYKDLRDLGVAKLLALISKFVHPEMARHILNVSAEEIKPFLLSTVSDRVDSWHLPGLLLLGDAAHTASPVGAQGINLGIRDAIVAANHLIPILSKPSNLNDIDAILETIEKERLSEIKSIQRIQSFPPKLLLKNTWYSKLILSLISTFSRDMTILAPINGPFAKFAWGVSEVFWNNSQQAKTSAPKSFD
jgi:2-polyprenyl-6-methoxyphenol hydroxylase-like FAD-dependent oxidoreductase